jgi:hypothetical protein
MTQTATRPSVFVATPCFGGLVSQHYMQSVIGLIQFASQAGFDATLALLGHDSLITRSRNTLVTQFLNTPAATHLLFIDADISFEAEQVFHMLNFNREFVAGIYPLKVIDWNNAAIMRAATVREPFPPRRCFMWARSALGTHSSARDGSPPASIAAAASCF